MKKLIQEKIKNQLKGYNYSSEHTVSDEVFNTVIELNELYDLQLDADEFNALLIIVDNEELPKEVA